MRSYDSDGDGKFSKDEVHAMAADFIKEKKTRRLATKAAIAMGVLILLVVGLNAGLTAAIVFLSKEVKVVGGVLVDPSTNEPLMTRSADTKVASDGSLRDQKTGGVSVSTHGQKNVFEVTLTVSGHDRLDEQGSGDIQGHLQEPVAQVVCKNVLLAVSSIENGDDESLVKITLGEGLFWEPRMSAASYHLHENSFGIDELYLRDRRAVLYDVNCEISKEACETNPSTLCNVLPSAATAPRALSSFEDAFDGDVRRRLTHAGVEHKTAENCAERGCFDHCPQPEPCVRRSVICECSTPYPWSCSVSHASNVELCQGTYSGPSEGGFNANLNRFG